MANMFPNKETYNFNNNDIAKPLLLDIILLTGTILNEFINELCPFTIIRHFITSFII